MALSVFLKKTFADSKSGFSQKGQAIVEYILMLVITVSLILGLLYQFNDAFKNFLDSYFGDYIACLLETGELPALGGDGPNQGTCNAGFANFSIASGRPSTSDSSSGSSGSNGDSSSSSDSGGSVGSTPSRGSRPARFTGSSAPSNSEAGSSGSNRSRPAKQRLANGGGDATGLNSGSSEGGSGRRGRRIRRKKIIYLGEEYLSQKAKKKKDKLVSTGKKTEAEIDQANLRKASFELKVPEPKREITSDDNSGFSFAFFIKIMLIAGIILTLLLFFGGQALQIKKSWQKSE